MYIAMNRFTIKKGNEEQFEQAWRGRESGLKDMPGFIDFHLLRCDAENEEEQSTLFVSYSVWRSKEDLVQWTKSVHFRDAHKNAGERHWLLAGKPRFEGFDIVLNS